MQQIFIILFKIEKGSFRVENMSRMLNVNVNDITTGKKAAIEIMFSVKQSRCNFENGLMGFHVSKIDANLHKLTLFNYEWRKKNIYNIRAHIILHVNENVVSPLYLLLLFGMSWTIRKN